MSGGESHGPKISAIIDGIPSGFNIDINAINFQLLRRQKGFGCSARMKIEKDVVVFFSGVINGKTTGLPIGFEITNNDYSKNWKNKTIKPRAVPRPGHVDFVGSVKYFHNDLRLSAERASARETVVKVVMGSICQQVLSYFQIRVCGFVIQIGNIKAKRNKDVSMDIENSKKSEFCFSDIDKEKMVRQEIFKIMKKKDTLGGIIEIVINNVPIGLGSFSQFDQRLDAQIALAMMSIPSVKGVQFGDAFLNSSKKGTEVHDEFLIKGGILKRFSNNAAGIEGGVSNGQSIIVRIALKPINTILKSRKSINLFTGEKTDTIYQRSDFCAVTRAIPVAEAMCSYVLLNSFLCKVGGFSKLEMVKNFNIVR